MEKQFRIDIELIERKTMILNAKNKREAEKKGYEEFMKKLKKKDFIIDCEPNFW